MAELGAHGTSHRRVRKGRGKLGLPGSAGEEEQGCGFPGEPGLAGCGAAPRHGKEVGVKGGRPRRRASCRARALPAERQSWGERGAADSSRSSSEKTNWSGKKKPNNPSPSPWWQSASSSWFRKDKSA